MYPVKVSIYRYKVKRSVVLDEEIDGVQPLGPRQLVLSDKRL